MNTTETTIIQGLTLAQSHLADTVELSNEALSSLIPLARILGAWLDATLNEAASRARDGVHYDGYRLKKTTWRKITDPEGALQAIRSFNPDLVPLCQKTELAGILELTKRFGKPRFDELFGPYMTQYSSFRLIPDID